MKLTEQIKQALEASEIGPWALLEFSNAQMEVWQSIDNSGICKIYGDDDTAKANATLIANAPTWLSQLLQEREQMVETIRDMIECSDITTAVNELGNNLLKQVGELE